MELNFNWLFSFACFAEHLNFTHAARALHISQPALHVQIKKLTEAVGRPLYARRGKAIQLTVEGKRIAAYGRDVQEQSRSLIGEIRGDETHSPVVLASGQGAFRYLLGDAVRRFPKNKMPLRLIVDQGPALVDAVRDGKAHLAVVAGQTSPEELHARPLCRVGQQVALPAHHRLASRARLRPKDLAGEALVVPPAGSAHRQMITQLFEAAGATWRVAVEAPGWELMIQFARYGVGLAIVNDFCTLPRGLVGIPLVGAPKRQYVMLARKITGRNRGAMRLAKLIQETTAQP